MQKLLRFIRRIGKVPSSPCPCWFALRGLLNVDMIAVLINYGQNFSSPPRQLANPYNYIQAAPAREERVFETIDIPGEVPTTRPP